MFRPPWNLDLSFVMFVDSSGFNLALQFNHPVIKGNKSKISSDFLSHMW